MSNLASRIIFAVLLLCACFAQSQVTVVPVPLRANLLIGHKVFTDRGAPKPEASQSQLTTTFADNRDLQVKSHYWTLVKA